MSPSFGKIRGLTGEDEAHWFSHDRSRRWAGERGSISTRKTTAWYVDQDRVGKRLCGNRHQGDIHFCSRRFAVNPFRERLEDINVDVIQNPLFDWKNSNRGQFLLQISMRLWNWMRVRSQDVATCPHKDSGSCIQKKNFDFAIAQRKLWLRETNNVRGHHGKAVREEINTIANVRLIGKSSIQQPTAFVYLTELIGVASSLPSPSRDANDGGADRMAAITTADFQYLRAIEKRNPIWSEKRSKL
jgi:hypothetical protein